MSADFHLSLSAKNICPKALNAECDTYDGWEPSKKCLTNNDSNCKRVKA